MEAANITGESGGTLNRQVKSAARSAFESAKQRFFGHLLTSMKTPTLIAAIEADLAAGHAAVIQIVSTGEALMERRLSDSIASAARLPPLRWAQPGVSRQTPPNQVLSLPVLRSLTLPWTPARISSFGAAVSASCSAAH